MKPKKRRSISALTAIPGLTALGLTSTPRPPRGLESQLTQYAACRSHVESLCTALDGYRSSLNTLAKAAGKVAEELSAIAEVGDIGAWEKAALDNAVKDCRGVAKGCGSGVEVVDGVRTDVGRLLKGNDGESEDESEGVVNEKVMGEEKVGEMVKQWEEVEKRWRKKGKKEARWGERMAEVDAELRRVLGGVNEGLGALVGGVVGDLGRVGTCLVREVDTKTGVLAGNNKLPDDGRVSKTSSVTVDFEDIEAMKVLPAGDGSGDNMDHPAEGLADVRYRRESTSLSPLTTPLPPPPPISQRMMAEFNFRGEEGELNFQAGDVIEVVEKDDSGWWTGIAEGRRGLFPSNYTRPLGEEEVATYFHIIEEKKRARRKSSRHNRSHSAPEAIACLKHVA